MIDRITNVEGITAVSPCVQPHVIGSPSSDIQVDGKIYWAIHSYSVMLLIPKKRGVGFLKTPVGHHQNELSSFISRLGYDCCGLDGYLDIPVGYTHGQDFVPLVQEIANFYGKDAIEVHSDKILDWCVR